MAFHVFIFILFFCRTNDHKRHMDENNVRDCYRSFFKSTIPKITAIFKVFSEQLCGTLTTAFEIHLQLKILLIWINIGANFFLGNFIKQDPTKVPGKVSEPVLLRILHQDISLIIVCFFLSKTSLSFKFTLVLIR